jgi:hypothetical protein
MHKKPQFGKYFDGARAGQFTMFEQPGRDQPNAAEMERQMRIPSPTEKKNGPAEMPRRSRCSNFQKLMVEGIASRGKEGCDLSE